MFAADGTSLGYTNSNDKESVRTIHAALDSGITMFDTAAAYGVGHAECLLGAALKNRPDALVVTKIGFVLNETTKQIMGDEVSPKAALPAIERCLERLDRDHIDLLLLHLNALAPKQAVVIFDEMEKARTQGKIGAYGWSTDFSDNASAMAHREGFVAVEHAMNVLTDAPAIQSLAREYEWSTLIRSPLAMGLLSGKYQAGHAMPPDDIRSSTLQWMQYYRDSQPNPEYLARFNKVRELLQTDGRTAVQGALAWLWAKSAHNIPIPGARTAEQIEGLAAAMQFGPLPAAVMDDIEEVVDREQDWSEAMER